MSRRQQKPNLDRVGPVPERVDVPIGEIPLDEEPSGEGPPGELLLGPLPALGAISDHRVEAGVNKTIAWVLTVGLAAAISLMVAGAILAGIRSRVPIPHQTSFSGVLRGLARGEPGAFFDLGLIVLLATPAARVVTLLVAYGRRRQWLFAGISLFVLCILILSGYLGLTLG